MTVTPDNAARRARAGEALTARHAELREVLDHWAEGAGRRRGRGRRGPPGAEPAARLPHRRSAAARPRRGTHALRISQHDPDSSLLVRALISEHRDLASMAARLGRQAELPTAAQAAAISALFASHVAKEEQLLLPP